MSIYCFLPVESTPRELDYKLNLARLFCKAGFKVMLGYPPFIRDELKYKNYQGVFLEKGANPTPEYYSHLKDKGIFLYDHSDEGVAKPVYSINYQPAVDALRCMRKIFLWGEAQKEELISLNSDAEMVHKYQVVGSPAFDLSSPKYKYFHNKLKPQSLPDQYILVNTNFGMFNGHEIDELLKACSSMSDATYQSIVDSYEFEKKQFGVFKNWLTEIIAHFPNEHFLIRPHPVEIKEKYHAVFDKFKNVTISKAGNVNQAIASAKMILHKDCTTALQSYLMEVPVISLGGPELNQQYAQWSMAFGRSPQTVTEAIDMINFILANNEWDEATKSEINSVARQTAGSLFLNLGNSCQTMTDFIVNDVNINLKDEALRLIDRRSPLQKIKMFIRTFLPLYYKVASAERETLTPFNKSDVLTRLKLLEHIEPLGFELSVRKIYPNTFMIEKLS